MNFQQALLIHSNWEKINHHAEFTARLFFRRLFFVAPHMRLIFRDRLVQQGQYLMQVIDAAINDIDPPYGLTPIATAWASQYAGHGLRNSDCCIIFNVLLWTFAMQIPDAGFTRNAENAWIEVFDLIALAMQQGMDKKYRQEPSLKAA
jgi:hemoglobin-like flavoprotein